MIELIEMSKFDGCVGEKFSLKANENVTLELELTEVEALPDRGDRPSLKANADGILEPDFDNPCTRKPFSLIFKLEGEMTFGQSTVTLSNEKTGDVTLFLVPIAGGSDSTTFQAIFN